jgi:ribosomal-protein-alanine N-acetyltransferase
MIIGVAGPYSAGTPELRQKNLDKMNQAAARLLELGHIPLIGVNAALPVVNAAKVTDRYKAIMDISLTVIDKCEALLLLAESPGANMERDHVISKGLPVYYHLDEVPSPMMLMETERLFLREIVPEDAEIAYQLNLDPEVIKYTSDGPFKCTEDARGFLRNYDHYKKYGFGRWAVISKQNQEFIGWCGLKYDKDLNEYDLGFRFFKKYWNQGYATEAAKFCLDLGFKHFKMPAIVARAREENKASVKVIENCGLKFHSSYVEEGNAWVKYEITGNKK